MKKILLAFAILLFGATVFAHQPRITWDAEMPIQVQNPEISQAFYGELRGQPDTYQIIMDTGFFLYVNILVPGLEDAKKDFQIYILQDSNLLIALDGKNHERKEFYEHFAGDLYYGGPTFEQTVEAGQYTIIVDNASHEGKYSLAIGKIESFPFPEMINTFKALPKLKTYFFEKPVLAMFWNYLGLGLGIILLGIILIIIGIRTIIKKRRKKISPSN